MGRIKEKFKELAARKEGALVGYITLGDPDVKTSEKIASSLLENCDLLELGIPFSDPIADGPTIQGAIERALEAGMNTDIAFETVEKLRKRGEEKPLVFMTYYNIVLQYGEERFVKRCRESGVDGVLVSDLPLEEASSFMEHCKKNKIDPIFLISPNTPEERIKKIAANGKGFLYLVSVLGVTGARERVQEATLEKIKQVKGLIGGLPLCVGFGISKKEHVEAVIGAGADGAVVGSAFVRIIEKKREDACEDLRKLSGELKEETQRGKHL